MVTLRSQSSELEPDWTYRHRALSFACYDLRLSISINAAYFIFGDQR